MTGAVEYAILAVNACQKWAHANMPSEAYAITPLVADLLAQRLRRGYRIVRIENIGGELVAILREQHATDTDYRIRSFETIAREGRTIQLYPDGIRRVIVDHDDSWYVYVIIPRETANKYIRRMREDHHVALHDLTVGKWIPEGLLNPESYAGPGQAFYRAPVRYRFNRAGGKLRRFVVIAQAFGIDC